MNSKSRGFITLATGEDIYYQDAKNLLDSYHLMGGQYPFSIICDRYNQFSIAFDSTLVNNDLTGYCQELCAKKDCRICE